MKRTIVLGLLALISTGTSVVAVEMSWTMQPIGTPQTYLGQTLGLVMDREQTWPTVFCGQPYGVQAASSTPAGWMFEGIGPTGMAPPPGRLRAAARPDGQCGAIYATKTGYTLSQRSRTGWQSTAFDDPNHTANPDLAYTSDSRPIAAYGNGGYVRVSAFTGSGWNTEDVSLSGSRINGSKLSVAVDSLDRVNLAWSTGYGVQCAIKNPTSGEWVSSKQSGLYGIADVQHISLAFGPNDEPAMLISQPSQLTYAWFDITSGLWKTESAASQVGSLFSELVFDNNGSPCFTYVDRLGAPNNLHFLRRGDTGWQDTVLPARAALQVGASLAFDRENLPVIAFYGESGSYPGLTLAYDPILVPEPASLALLGLTALLFTRRKR